MNAKSKQQSIKIINNTSLSHKQIEEYLAPTLGMLGDMSKVVSVNEIDDFFTFPFDIVNKHALVFVDAWDYSRKRDWNSLINRILTHSEKEDRNCNIIIATRQHLQKPLIRSSKVSLLLIK